MDKIDPYSTHLELLQKIFDFIGRQKNVVEFGMGKYSTDLLLNNSENLVSIEMQSEDWYNSMLELFKDRKNWKPLMLLGPHQYTACIFKNINFAFVDGHGESRPEVVNLMFEKNVPVIIAHDTEAGCYGWTRIKEPFKYNSFTFKRHENWSTVWTVNDELFEYLEKCLY